MAEMGYLYSFVLRSSSHHEAASHHAPAKSRLLAKPPPPSRGPTVRALRAVMGARLSAMPARLAPRLLSRADLPLSTNAHSSHASGQLGTM